MYYSSGNYEAFAKPKKPENVDKKSYEEYKANDDSDLEEDEGFEEENESNNELNYSEETELESYIDEDNELEEDSLDYEEEL